MTAKIVLITGANNGIGLATVKALAESKECYKVIVSGRSIDKVHAAISEVQSQHPSSASTFAPVQLDVTDDSSIEAAFKTVSSSFDVVDVIVNNAGAHFDRFLLDSSLTAREAFARSWDTNVTGAHIVTETFAGLLVKSIDPRLIFITSGSACLEATFEQGSALTAAPPKGWPKPKGMTSTSYRSAKVGLNMLMREWERILRDDGVKVFSLSPGFLATGLAGNVDLRKMGAGEPSVGGEAVRKVIEGDRDAHVGKVVRYYVDDPVQPW